MNKRKVSNNDKKSENKLIYKIITLIIPVLFLLIFEGSLRIAGYGDNLKLFIKNSTEGYEKFMMVNPEIGKKYFQKFEYTSPANDIFYKNKPKNTFRIFVMGSSTVYGFPYERNLMFSRILNQQLNDAYPNKNIEIINTSITAINSFTLYDYTDEILKYEPDAILIYAGHNEFYGAFGIGSNETMSKNRMLTQLHLTLLDSRVYQLVRNVISGIARNIAKNNKNKVHGTLMKRIVASNDILFDSEEYNIALESYKQNMAGILKKTNKKDVPVFFSEVVSNIKGIEPFNSISNDTHEAADIVYKKAQNAEKNHNYEKALELYYDAKDLDCIRFRASEDINRIINELAKEYDVNKVPMLSWFQSNSENQLIGNNLMTEHVHPNINGNFLMAEAFYTEIEKSGTVEEKNEMPYSSLEYYRKNWGYTELDTLLGHHRVKQLMGFWPFISDENKEYNYKNIYKPKSYTDSLVFSILKNSELTLAEIRLNLARKYEKEGQIFKAFKEYEALLRSNPYIAVNYRDAANCLLQLSDLPLALKYFQKSLEYEESFFAVFRIAEIYLLKSDFNNAILYFEKAFALAPDDKKINVLAKSYIAFVYANNIKKAKAVASELKRVNASKYLKIPLKKYVFDQYIPYQTRDQINNARQLITENKNNEALNLLESSLQIYNSHIAIRMIGEINFKQQNNEKALSSYNKVYKQFKYDPAFLHDMFLLYMDKKDIENAKKYLQEISIIDPDYKHLNHLSSLLSKPN